MSPPRRKWHVTFKKIARLVKSDNVSLVEKTVTFDFSDGRDPLTVAADVLIESRIIIAPPS